MSHFVPLHPQVVTAVRPLLEGRKNEDRVFAYVSFLMWIKRKKISMSRFNGHFVLGDLRKFAEQHGDIIRLPRDFKALAGETAHIYETEQECKLAFLVTVDKKVGKVCANLNKSQMKSRFAVRQN
jgi:hypothetical protein